MMITAIGTMSGTSMDGIDVALIQTDGINHIKQLADYSLRYPSWFHLLLKAAEYTVRQQQGNLTLAANHFLSALNQYLKQEFNLNDNQTSSRADELHSQFFNAVNRPLNFDNVIFYSTKLHCEAIQQLLEQANYQAEQIDVIGYHGQTLLHKPEYRITVQVGNAQYLAKQLGITVVSDFRHNDVQHGGQGAPFAPLYHQALATQDNLVPCAVINCGGIANITVINGQAPEDLLSFDIGPGNGLIDRWIKQQTQGQMQMDVDGQFGLRGKVDTHVLSQLHSKAILNEQGINFLTVPPPKSLDIADLALIPDLNHLSLADGCRTLEAFTAECIAAALELIKIAKWPLPNSLILVGGGWYNPVIQQELAERLATQDIKLLTAETIGWNNKALEAQIFAYLAVRSLQSLPISLPQTTGVPYPLTGGKVYAG